MAVAFKMLVFTLYFDMIEINMTLDD